MLRFAQKEKLPKRFMSVGGLTSYCSICDFPAFSKKQTGE